MRIIAGKHRGKRLFSSPSSHLRPSSALLRETLFNICQNTIEKATFLDLFSGTGAIGLEALSRGAQHVVFVDQKSAVTQKNIHKLQEEAHATLLPKDVFYALKTLFSKKMQFDIIFADPPYGKQLAERVLQFVETHAELLKEGGELFLEEETQTPLFSPSLSHLTLVNQRQMGSTSLYYYQKR